MGDLGGYGIAYQPPAGHHFPPRALPGPWGKMVTLGRLVCNSISTLVTHAKITHFKMAQMCQDTAKLLCGWSMILLLLSPPLPYFISQMEQCFYDAASTSSNID